MAIAVAQLNATADRASNLDRAEALVREAVGAGARLVALPEYFTAYGHPVSPASLRSVYAEAIETIPGETSERLGALAAELEIYLLGGSYFEGADSRVFNTSCLFDSAGRLVALYRKTHLFEARSPTLAYHEGAAITAGDELVTSTIEIDGHSVVGGLSICFDLRFPELYRKLVADLQAEIIFVPSAFPRETGRDHWELLVRARAVENQSFVIAPAQWGQQADGSGLHGRSMIVDPWGTVLATAADGEGFALASLDLDQTRIYRDAYPNLANRRPSLYAR